MSSIPINEKLNLTIQEAAEYSNIGQKRIYEWVRSKKDLDFVLRVGKKKILIKRKEFEEYIANRLYV